MRKRSKYKPKGVRLDVMSWVRAGFEVLDSRGLTLKIKNHAAMASIVRGTGTIADVDILISAMNITEALAVHGKGEEWLAEIRAAEDAIKSMAERGLRLNNKFLFTGPEMKALNLGMDIHDAQLDACTVADVEKAIDLVAKEVRLKRVRIIEKEEV